MIWYPTRGLKNSWRCVELQITYLLSKSMESWQTFLMSGNEELARLNIKRVIFQRDTLSPFMFVIGLIPLSHTLRKVNAGYQLGKGLYKKSNHLLFMDNLKLYGNSKKEAERLTNTVKNIFEGYCYGVWY